MSEPTGPIPAEEEEPHIHLPPPSYWPIILAIGTAMALAGIVIYPAVWIVGIIVALVALAGWLRELGHDLAVAPSEPE
ncbi:MAG TPA: cytochrome c oxidase subunit 4 [Chloroflexota bacterium]|nr:cytochrome c oxidase subunit 4 [Chloroflexota bacterium]